MHSEASSSQPSVSLNGSGALSHVCIHYPPLRCSISGSKGFFYDDGNKLLLCPTSDQVFSWKISPFDANVEPKLDPISEGNIVSLRYSLDTQILAIQRSNHEIQFFDKKSEETFSYKCRPDTETILGFFWTDCASCDIVIVKSSGLDLLSYDSELKNLRLTESKRMNVSWYAYTHESRLVLLASGLQCKTFVGFQLSSSGIIRLPKFDMVMAKLDANSRPVLSAEDIHIITVYGRIYCLQVDRVAMLLHCYRFYRDAVVQQGSLPIYSSKIAVSVVDNVLLVHQVDAKVVILYDIFADSRAPISAPLPLLLKGYPRATPSSYRLEGNDNAVSTAKDTIDQEVVLYGDEWTFLVPDIICDKAKGLLWKVQLNLEAISASSSEAPLILEFLQRRKLEANKAKMLCLAIGRTIILERRPVAIVARALDVLVTSYSNAIKSGIYFKGLKPDKIPSSSAQHVISPRMPANESSRITDSRGKSINTEASANQSSVYSASDSEEENTQLPETNNVPLGTNLSEQQHDAQITSAAISPNEIYQHVFAPVDEEMADPAYLISVIVEFLRSANAERIRIHPNLYVLTIQLLSRSGKYAELGLFIINKIIEPSREVALQLLESGRQNYQTKKLGMDMLRQLSFHQEYILSLVQDGYYLEALRYARKHKVNTIRPSLFLEAAYSSNNSQHLAAVLRFLADFIPGFKNTTDHIAYCHILTEMNASVAA